MDQRLALGSVVGVAVAAASAVVPFVTFVSPLLGGAAAALIAGGGLGRGARAGAATGVILGVLGLLLFAFGAHVPAIPAAVVAGPWVRAVPVGGGFPTLPFLAVNVLVLAVVCGAGGALAAFAVGGSR